MSGCNDHLGQGWCSWRAPPCRRGRRGGGPEFALIMAEPHDRQRRGCGLIQRGYRNISRSIAAPKGQWGARRRMVRRPRHKQRFGHAFLAPVGRQAADSRQQPPPQPQRPVVPTSPPCPLPQQSVAHSTTTIRGPRCPFPATRARPQTMMLPQIPFKKLQLRTAMHPHPSPLID